MTKLDETERILMRGGDHFDLVGRLARPTMTLDAEIGLRVRRIRRALDMTQSDLAELVHYAVPTISRMERGTYRFTADTIALFAQALGVREDLLTGGVDLTNRKKRRDKNDG